MKPLDIHNLLVSFRNVMTDPDLNNQAKLAIGKEVFTSLPASLLCPSSKSTLEVVTETIQRRLQELEKEIGRETVEPTKEVQDSQKAKRETAKQRKHNA